MSASRLASFAESLYLVDLFGVGASVPMLLTVGALADRGRIDDGFP
jgi:hypothetical protein